MSLNRALAEGAAEGVRRGMESAVPSLVDLTLKALFDSPWYPFIVGGQIRLMEAGMAPAKAWELSRKTCHAFVREQKITFGDPAFDWSAAGGRTVVEDWEIEHWEHSA